MRQGGGRGTLPLERRYHVQTLRITKRKVTTPPECRRRRKPAPDTQRVAGQAGTGPTTSSASETSQAPGRGTWAPRSDGEAAARGWDAARWSPERPWCDHVRKELRWRSPWVTRAHRAAFYSPARPLVPFDRLLTAPAFGAHRRCSPARSARCRCKQPSRLFHASSGRCSISFKRVERALSCAALHSAAGASTP